MGGFPTFALKSSALPAHSPRSVRFQPPPWLFGVWLLLLACGGSRPRSVTVPSSIFDHEAPLQANREGALRPGDAVRVTVFQEPDLTGEYQVDQNGLVVFPLLGERDLVGVSADSVERLLTSEYRRYLEHPSIDVTALRRISILGGVRRPGLYFVDLTMSLNEALALAGGLASAGDLDDIRLLRRGQTIQLNLEGGVPLSAMPILSGDEIFVGDRDHIMLAAGG
ncbi:MAG: polysaccharide biosynthesis/export family protein [Gemmatimonadota bacterium]|nr:polysaccharide biosynthesis/export family protein [Gemmatimonadota bacterium]